MPQALTPAGFAIWRKQFPNATACFIQGNRVKKQVTNV
jgi:hypothetical protein